MSDSKVFVVYSAGPGDRTFPYGVFSSRPAAQDAREVIIENLEASATRQDVIGSIHADAGTFDEQILIEECTLQDAFSSDDLGTLLE